MYLTVNTKIVVTLLVFGVYKFSNSNPQIATFWGHAPSILQSQGIPATPPPPPMKIPVSAHVYYNCTYASSFAFTKGIINYSC